MNIFTSYATDLLLNGLERRPDHFIKRSTGVVDVYSPGELRRRGSYVGRFNPAKKVVGLVEKIGRDHFFALNSKMVIIYDGHVHRSWVILRFF